MADPQSPFRFSQKAAFSVRRTAGTVPLFPDAASMGETFAARLAGACAARRTVTTPDSAPAASPAGLTASTGVEANSRR